MSLGINASPGVMTISCVLPLVVVEILLLKELAKHLKKKAKWQAKKDKAAAEKAAKEQADG